jgi:hypothetical protein
VASGAVVFLLIWWNQFSLWRRDAMGVDLLASLSAGATCRGHASSCVLLVPSRMGGTGARICVERGVGGIVVVTPCRCRGMDVVAVE